MIQINKIQKFHQKLLNKKIMNKLITFIINKLILFNVSSKKRQNKYKRYKMINLVW